MSGIAGREIARSLLSVVLAGLLALLSGPAQIVWAANMVANPGFENGAGTPTDWSTTSPSMSLARDTTIFHSGAASLKATDNTTAVNTPHIVTSAPFAVTGGTVYDFSYWYFLQAGHNVDLVSATPFFYSNAGCTTLVGPFAQFNAPDYSTGVWHQASGRVTAPASAQCVAIEFRVSVAVAGAGVVNFDDVFFDVASPGALALSSPTYTVGEQGPIASITITRTGGVTGTVGATVNLTNGTATAPDDYDNSALSVSLADNVTSTTVQVPIVNDLIDEDDETVNLTLANPTGGATLGAQTTAVLTIQDNDTAGVTVSPTAGLVTTEAGGTATFTVNLNSQPTQQVTIALASRDITEGTISPAQATLTFPPNSTALNTQTVTVTGVQDAIADGNVAYSITTGTTQSADPKYDNTVNGADVGVTNSDDDTAGLTVTQSDSATAVTEGGATDTVSLVLTSQPSANVSVSFATGSQVQPIGSITFTGGPAGNWNQAQDVIVAAVDDAVAEGAHSGTIVFTVASSDAAYNGFNVPNIVASIADNDGVPGLTISDATVAEGDAGTSALGFTVTLAPPSSGTVTVAYATANGTATGGAACAAGVDYLTTSGPLTFQPGETSKPIVITVCADTLTEGTENLLVTLGNPTGGAAIADGQGQGTISDDDVAGTLSFSAAAAQVAESAGSVTLTVQRAGAGIAATGQPTTASAGATPGGNVPSGSVRPNAAPSVPVGASAPVSPNAVSAVTVNYATANGTAQAGLDFTATSGTLSFGVGETTKTIVIPILPDAVDEQPETFTVTLSAPSGGATLGATSTATVTITDADTTPCQTVLTAAVPAGTQALPVVSQAGCNVGDTVAIDLGQPNEERGLILGFGSIVLQQPTTQAHAAGAIVVRVPASPPAGAYIDPGDDSADVEREERERETEEERRQRARTNQGNRDDDSVEGDVIETRCDEPWPSVVIANRDGAVEVKLIKEAQKACSSISAGDYLEADGEKQHEGLFHADSVDIKRRR